MTEVHKGHQHYLWFVILLLLLAFAGAVLLFQEKEVESGGSVSVSPTLDMHGRTYSVFYNKGVFSPTILQIRAGDLVNFRNESNNSFELFSDLHPDHNQLGEIASGVVKKGEAWTFVFNKKGIFGYHNEVKPEEGGTIIVK